MMMMMMEQGSAPLPPTYQPTYILHPPSNDHPCSHHVLYIHTYIHTTYIHTYTTNDISSTYLPLIYLPTYLPTFKNGLKDPQGLWGQPPILSHLLLIISSFGSEKGGGGGGLMMMMMMWGMRRQEDEEVDPVLDLAVVAGLFVRGGDEGACVCMYVCM